MTTTTLEQTTDLAIAWSWLSETERAFLLCFNPEAERLINEKITVALLTETQYLPYTPVGTTERTQGGAMPYLPKLHIVTNERTSRSVEIHHPRDSSFTKHEDRTCVAVTVRKRYGGLDFPKLVAAVMTPELAALPWAIYEPSYNGTQHIYLNTAGPGVNGDKKIALYVPVEYFRDHDYSAVEAFHNDVAVGYYAKPHGRDPELCKEWAALTATALTKPEAEAMRELVEGVHNCAKCGLRFFTSDGVEDIGLQGGQTFYYCSEDCKVRH